MLQRPKPFPQSSRATLAMLICAIGQGCGAPASTPPVGIDTSFLRDYAETRGFSAGRPTGIKMTPAGDAALFLRSGPRDVVRNLYEMNVATGTVRCLARAEDLLQGEEEELTPEEKARRERMRMSARGITRFRLSKDAKKVLIGLSGNLYVIRRSDGQVSRLPESQAGPARDARFSPNGEYVSCIRGHDLYVIDLAKMEERAVTTGGTADLAHGVAEFVAQEEMRRRTGYWWSGDSGHFAYAEVDQGEVETLHIADATHPEKKPKGWRYPRAGTANARVRLGIIPATGGTTTWVEWDRKRYPYLATVHWGENAPLTIYVQTRGQREAILYRVDHKTGRTTELLREQDAAWLNIDADMPRWLEKDEQFLWTSERSGEWQLELRSKDGDLIRSMTPGQARLHDVVAVDQARRDVIVSGASGPTQRHLFRLSLDDNGVVALTQGTGSHAGVFAKDCNLWAHTVSASDGTIQQAIRGRDATVRRVLPSVAETPASVSQVEWTTVPAGGRSYHAALIRPKDFQAGRSYPVIVYVYGGPGATVVSANARRYLRQQWIADQGFIVVCADGRGTPRRGREWERATSYNLIDAPLADQVSALQALGEEYGELDMSRVGIYGWSFGGYFSAMAVARRPDVFHAGVAGAPVIDWRDYDTHYTERYMGRPQDNPQGYEDCSVLSYADQLERPLLLIHGTTDDNVYFTHTLKMHDALFRAGKPHELLVLPGFTHMVSEPEVTMRLYERIVRFFRKHLAERNAPNEATGE